VSDREELIGGGPQGSTGHALTGAVGEVAEAFLGQGAGPLTGQGLGSLEELIEQSRTS
jgi:hypothetical protein